MVEHGFYSYRLGKPFKTLEELQVEEEKLANKEKQEKKAKEDRARDAEEIEKLLAQREALSEEINKKINAFIEKYKTYHYTLRSTYDYQKNKLLNLFKFL